ncbi:MAG: 4a-hydroxytetrahydrobiopterin dehydratase [Pirellula sp.]
MQIVSAEQLVSRKCLPCEGGVEACSLDHSQAQIEKLSGWQLSPDGKWIYRSLTFKNFVQTVECLNSIAELAEAEAHHPDLHLTGYRNLKIGLSTHAIGGLSENDFILASKIDALIVERFPKVANPPAKPS